MTDIPIIFSAPMVQALLAGRKTMTRRLLYTKHKARDGVTQSGTFLRDHPPPRGPLSPAGFPTDIGPDEYWTLSGWHKVRAGDRLWVRENFWQFGRWQGSKKAGKVSYTFEPRIQAGDLRYAADDNSASMPLVSNRGKFGQSEPAWHLRPNIFLERQHSRLTLVVTATKIEKLQDITEADAMAEGVERATAGHGETGGMSYIIKTFRTGFVWVWAQLHGAESWLANPEVVALTFTVHKQNIDAMKAAA